MMKLSISILLISAVLAFRMPASAEGRVPGHQLQIRFDLKANRLIGKSAINIPSGQAVAIHMNGLIITSVRLDGKPIGPGKESASIKLEADNKDRVFEADYEASYGIARTSGKEDGIESANIISEDGVVLTNSWHPVIDGPSIMKLSAVVPDAFEAISEADQIVVKQNGSMKEFTFNFDHTVDSLNFIAGRYAVRKVMHGEIGIYSYFFEEDAGLAAEYIEKTRKYLDMYSGMIGPFPYSRFSVVENMLPTGYSMPTFTLLGRDVVRLPFITETSLGHEILHQWFGNAVSIDRKDGNWAEGLTTYLSDHQYEEIKGKGAEYRKKILTEYQSYITTENDFSLKNFTSRSDRATASVGYGKTAMLFHSLREMLGSDMFDRGIREFFVKNRFGSASWQDIKNAFEAVSGTRLDWFFRQWTEEKGAFDFGVSDVMVRYEGTKAVVSFKILQDKAMRFRLPVLLKTDKDEIRQILDVEKEESSFEIETYNIPSELVIDERYDLFRKLEDDETVPIVSMLLGDLKRTFVLPKGREKDYEGIDNFLKENGFVLKKEDELKYEDIKGASLLVPSDAGLLKRLYAKVDLPEGDFSIVMRGNPYDSKKVVGIMTGLGPEETERYLRKIRHYGKYSILSFSGGKNISKKTKESHQGIRISLYDEIPALEIPRLTSVSGVIENVKGRGIVYIGEQHDRFDHHRMQYQIIRELYGKNRDIAIGMEMFQKPFQKVIDDYISGEIDERTFLKKSEYFKRWGFDYNLYREILLFAKEKKIPVIALNIKKEIVSKVAKQGLQSLTEDEMKELPKEMDLSDSEYRERLRGFFNKHSGSDGRNFDFFFQSQVLWDESMAQNINEYSVKNPDRKIVVLAGAGHMAFGSGIPLRTKRLNGRGYSVILNSDDVEKNIADYILYPSPLSYPESSKLMVMLKDEDKTVIITGFGADSIAEKAGLRINDIIVSIDGENVETIDDIKVPLFFKKKGDSVKVKVSRKRFLFGPREIEFSIVF